IRTLRTQRDIVRIASAAGALRGAQQLGEVGGCTGHVDGPRHGTMDLLGVEAGATLDQLETVDIGPGAGVRLDLALRGAVTQHHKDVAPRAWLGVEVEVLWWRHVVAEVSTHFEVVAKVAAPTAGGNAGDEGERQESQNQKVSHIDDRDGDTRDRVRCVARCDASQRLLQVPGQGSRGKTGLVHSPTAALLVTNTVASAYPISMATLTRNHDTVVTRRQPSAKREDRRANSFRRAQRAVAPAVRALPCDRGPGPPRCRRRGWSR